ncbi:MAG: alkane 1-monooxygenase [Flavobacteriales bacterium]|nr:MAG: alkane 1-monooxygenase [Flavobacteriales bacterium]
MNARILKYCSILTGPLVGIVSLTQYGLWTWALPLYAFALVPLVEFLSKGSEKNMSEAEEEAAKSDPWYDYLLYFMVPLQYVMMAVFLFYIIEPELTWFEITGKVLAFGISCAALGINVGHELGHRATRHERFMAKTLLLSTLYMHFIIEHNRGHHKRVATNEDPASAKYGEIIYLFWFKSVIFGFISAWKLEAARLKKNGKPFFSIHNEMIRFQFIQLLLVGSIYAIFGLKATVCFMICALIGILVLETINYIEHYGLRRKKTGENTYERTLPIHSWNSNHPFGRIMLFELTRHSDHHYKASRKYQILRHFDEAPLMPTGYPGMMMLSLIPPLWFYVMHSHIEKCRKIMPLATSA